MQKIFIKVIRVTGSRGFLIFFFGKELFGKAGEMFRFPELANLPVFILSVPGAAASAAADNQKQVIGNALFCIFPVLLRVGFPQDSHPFCPVVSRVAAAAIFYTYLHVLFLSAKSALEKAVALC